MSRFYRPCEVVCVLACEERATSAHGREPWRRQGGRVPVLRARRYKQQTGYIALGHLPCRAWVLQRTRLLSLPCHGSRTHIESFLGAEITPLHKGFHRCNNDQDPKRTRRYSSAITERASEYLSCEHQTAEYLLEFVHFGYSLLVHHLRCGVFDAQPLRESRVPQTRAVDMVDAIGRNAYMTILTGRSKGTLRGEATGGENI